MQRARTLLVLLALATLPPGASAAVTFHRVALGAANEVPPNGSPATGSAVVRFDTVTSTLSWRITFDGLIAGETGAHFHNAAAGVNGPVIVPLPLGSPKAGSATLTAGQAMALAAGEVYLNIHSSTYPGGEIRGQVLPLDPAADDDGDGVPNGVEVTESLDAFVRDNDLFSPGAGSARLFAMQQYRDFLGREGDPAGIAGWSDLVTAGTYSRPQAIDAFVNSPEFGGFVAPVVRLYFATYLRIPDYAGLAFNAGLVRAGTVTLQQLADFFTASPEFAALYGALDDAQFVTLLYNNVLGRAPDQAGLDGWVGLLGSGYTRGQVLLGFSDSVE
jgi:hypothetical protein